MLRNVHTNIISFIILCSIITATVVIGRYDGIKRFIKSEILYNNQSLIASYKKQIIEPNLENIIEIPPHDLHNLSKYPKLLDFLSQSSHFFVNLDYKVSIHHSNGDVIFSNKKYNINENKLKPNYPHQTLLNKFNNYLINKSIANIDNNLNIYSSSGRRFARDEIIIKYNQDSVLILEITRDITYYIEQLLYFEKRLILTIATIFLVFLIISFQYWKYTQYLLIRQFQNLKNPTSNSDNLFTSREASEIGFIGNISHELRTPLNAIIGFSEIMRDEAYGKINVAQYKDYVNDIYSSGQHLLTIINDILDFSKASASRLDVINIPTDITKLISATTRYFTLNADAKKIKLVQTLPNVCVIASIDPKRMKQILLNLISNAIKFTNPNGLIVVSTREDKGLVYVSVTDTGIGISDYDLPKALSAFTQIDNKSNKKYPGTGLGLPLSKRLVELMGGEFDISSKLGLGTSICIIFKAIPE